MPASVTMKGCSRKRWISQPISAPNAVPISSTSGIACVALQCWRSTSAAETMVVERDHRADRQVDAAGQDHEGHADADDAQEGVVDQQVEEHLRREEARCTRTRRSRRPARTRAIVPSSGTKRESMRSGPLTARSGGPAAPRAAQRGAEFGRLQQHHDEHHRRLDDHVDLGRHADRVDRRGQRLDDQRAEHAARQAEAPAR